MPHTHDDIDWVARLAPMRRTDRLEAPVNAEIAFRLAPLDGSTVIEIGPGAGGVASAFASVLRARGGGRIILVDAVPELLAAAAEHTAEAGGDAVEVLTVLADAGDDTVVDLVGEQADLVFAAKVVHHLPDERAGVARLARLVRPGGRLALLEGGLATRCLPYDVGIGAPGLQNRLIAARDRWYDAMRAGMAGAVRAPVGWNRVLSDAGLVDVGSFSLVVDLPAPAPPEVAETVVDWLRMLADVGAEWLDETDRAAVARLTDPDDPAYAGLRDDVFVLGAHTVFSGRRDVLCSRCGRSRGSAPAVEALSWVSGRDERGPSWLCPSCARTHVRDIEGKLPDEYWA